MSSIRTSSISLRVASRTINCREISSHLDMQPSKAYEKGEPLSARSAPNNKREEALWLFELGLDESLPLEKHIEELLKILKGKTARLKKIRENCDVEIFCCFSTENGQGGFVLNHNLLQELGLLEIDVVFDLYVL